MTARMRATRCPECKGITMAWREGVLCGECRGRRDEVLAEVNRARLRVAYRAKHGIAIGEDEAAVLEARRLEVQSICDEAAARGVPRYVIRAERARKAAGGRSASAATHAATASKTPATAQMSGLSVDSEGEPRSIGR